MKYHDTYSPDEEQDEGPSKSALKRQSTELQRLGESLIELSPAELDELQLPEKLRDAVDIAKRITANGGLYRQKQFIGKLMRKIDAEPIRLALEAKKQAQRTQVLRLRRVEQWRDRLLNEPAALAGFAAEFPAVDEKQVQRLIARARHERDHQHTPAAARELFRVLRDALDQPEENE
ncbi:MAG TPA: ribosome biogenesis factor YjgA [Steroidobacteraceae bacterium]|nr:ribosome biogenesis factor YjgA [Steroidobacteraceae bacterium]